MIEYDEMIAGLLAQAKVVNHGDGWFSADVSVDVNDGEPVLVLGDSERSIKSAIEALEFKLWALRRTLGRPIEERFREHVRECSSCSGPDDGCELGQELECELIDAGLDPGNVEFDRRWETRVKLVELRARVARRVLDGELDEKLEGLL